MGTELYNKLPLSLSLCDARDLQCWRMGLYTVIGCRHNAQCVIVSAADVRVSICMWGGEGASEYNHKRRLTWREASGALSSMRDAVGS